MALPAQAIGWCVKEHGALLVATIGPHRRAACVNFLYAVRRVAILNHMSDEIIERLWKQHKGKAEAVRVQIEEMNNDRG